MNVATKIGNVAFENCVMNAAGVMCMTAEELRQVAHSQAATFVTKTATVDARPGNPEPRYRDFGANSINSMGLPNNGLDYYLEFLSQEEDSLARTRFLSVSPLQQGDLEVLFTRIKEAGFKGLVELNLSCPNVPGKPQIAYDFEQTHAILTRAFDLYVQ